MKIAIDIDGTITENHGFFSKLSQLWDDDVFVITYRDIKDQKKTMQELKSLGIKYTKLFFVSSFEQKAEIVKEHGVSLFFDDMPEMLKDVPENIEVSPGKWTSARPDFVRTPAFLRPRLSVQVTLPDLTVAFSGISMVYFGLTTPIFSASLFDFLPFPCRKICKKCKTAAQE